MNIKLSDHFTYKRLLRFLLPSIVTMIVTSLYSIVDGFFVSNLVGKNEFAAVNLVMPVLMALGSFGFMIGTGGSALVAKTLGEGKEEKANSYFSMLIYVVIGIGVILSIIGFAYMPSIAKALGASDIIIKDCILYGRVLIVANTFFMLQNSFQSFLVTAEKPQLSLIISLFAGVSNIVMDYLFIKTFGMGLFGAALATAISQIIGGLIPLIYFLRKNNSLLRIVRTKLDMKALGRACLNGSSEMLSNVSTSFVSMLYNLQLIKIAAENGIASYGVIMYVNFVFMAFFLGLSIGGASIFSYHYGAGNTAELKNLFKKSMNIITIASVVMLVLGMTLARPLSNVFVGYDAQLLDMTANGMRIYALSFILCGFNIFGSAFFTALNNGLVSALISFLRTLVFQVGAILILPVLFGINGIWFSIVVAEGLTLLVTVVLLIKNRKKYQYV